MILFLRLFAIIAFVYSLNNAASAGDVIYGYGSHTCGAFIGASAGFPVGKFSDFDRNNHHYISDNILYLEWALAFITAISVTHPGIKDDVIKDSNSLDLWLRNWCTAHPTDQFEFAVLKFLRNETDKK